MIRRPPRSTQSRSSAASDVYKRQEGAKAAHRADPSGAAAGHPRSYRLWQAARPAVCHIPLDSAQLDKASCSSRGRTGDHRAWARCLGACLPAFLRQAYAAVRCADKPAISVAGPLAHPDDADIPETHAGSDLTYAQCALILALWPIDSSIPGCHWYHGIAGLKIKALRRFNGDGFPVLGPKPHVCTFFTLI